MNSFTSRYPNSVLHLDAVADPVLLPNEIEIVAGLLLPQPAIAVHIFTVQQVLASGERRSRRC